MIWELRKDKLARQHAKRTNQRNACHLPLEGKRPKQNPHPLGPVSVPRAAGLPRKANQKELKGLVRLIEPVSESY